MTDILVHNKMVKAMFKSRKVKELGIINVELLNAS